MKKHHLYRSSVTWTGNSGRGTSDYKGYSRNHEIAVPGKPVLAGSSDLAFRGDADRYTPEDLLLSSLSACHMLWYLHLCAINNVVVVEYTDDAEGRMTENEDGSGQFSEVILRPCVVVAEPSMRERAQELHAQANSMCFIARSVNFSVIHQPSVSSYEKA